MEAETWEEVSPEKGGLWAVRDQRAASGFPPENARPTSNASWEVPGVTGVKKGTKWNGCQRATRKNGFNVLFQESKINENIPMISKICTFQIKTSSDPA